MTVEPLASNRNALGQIVANMAIGTGIPVVGLFVLRLMLAVLPLIKDAGTLGDTDLTPLVLLKASLDTVIYVLIVRSCVVAAGAIRGRRPHLREVAATLPLAGVAIVATLAHSSYAGLVLQLAPDQGHRSTVVGYQFPGTAVDPSCPKQPLVPPQRAESARRGAASESRPLR